MKKIELGQQFVQAHLALFRCPTCHGHYLEVADQSVICEEGHRLDFAKKGTLYFLNKQVKTEYDDAMLGARQRVLQAGLFDQIIDAFAEALPATPQTILDVGCGEGTPLARLLSRRQQADVAVGFDISKAGIALASRYNDAAFFCVADLANLPFQAQQFSAILDLFSPSAYQEFERVLKPGGQLLKVIPNANYLIELRHLLYPSGSRQAVYDNQRVLDLFLEHYSQAKLTPIHYEFPLNQLAFSDLLAMTPLHWGATPEALAAAKEHGLTKITVDVTLLSATC